MKFKNPFLLLMLIAILISYQILNHKTHSEIQIPEVNGNVSDREAYNLKWRGGEVDHEQYTRVIGELKKQYSKNKKNKRIFKDGGISHWTDLGPKNIGGRVRAVAPHPSNSNEILIGAAAGGIWRSTNGGGSWNIMTEDVQAYPVMDIVFDPQDENIVYAATGELIGGGPDYPGRGILKSEDGGLTWNELPNATLPLLFINKIRIHPTNSDTLYVAGSNHTSNQIAGFGMIYRSINGGLSWSLIYSNPNVLSITDLEINQNNPSQLLMGTTNGAFISINHGFNFSPLVGNSPLITTLNNWIGGRCEIQYCPSNSGVAYILRNMVRDTSGNGFQDSVRTELWASLGNFNSWVLLASTESNADPSNAADQNILGAQGQYDNVLWVDPLTCSRLLLGGVNLWKYENATVTRISRWQDDIKGNDSGASNSIHADQHAIAEVSNYNGTSNPEVYIGNDGGVYKSNNIWTATQNSGWLAKNSDMNITQFYSGDISNGGDTIIGGSQDNSFFVDINASNGLKTWNTYTTGDGGYCAINRNNPMEMYATTQQGKLWRSLDGGSTFCCIAGMQPVACAIDCIIPTTFSDTADFIAPMKIDPNNYQSLYLGGQQLWRGTLQGTTWSIIKSDVVSQRFISAIDIQKSNSQVIWVGYDNGDLFRTTNGGTDWIKVDDFPIGLPNKIITDIDIHSHGSGTSAMVTLGGFDQSHIYYKPNGVNVWLTRAMDFPMQVNSVAWHPDVDDWVYIGTDIGVFASENRGVDWSITPLEINGEGPVFTGVRDLVWQGDGTDGSPYYLCSFTHGRGLFRTTYPLLSKVYVDKSYVGVEVGTQSKPFNSFEEALKVAGHGTDIEFLDGGTYPEAFRELKFRKLITSSDGSVIIE